MIKVTDLCKVFRTEEIETTALNNVSFEIKDGEFVAIMGPSGCGKSTLLNILGLLDNPTSGSYELLGHEVAKLKEKDRTKFRKGNIGFVFQSFNLIDELNALSEHQCIGKETESHRHPQENEHQPQGAAFPPATLRWPAAESGHCACCGRMA